MLATLLLQAAMGEWSQPVFLVVAMGIAYFFLMRPQQKRTAEAKAFRESLVKGARVVTIGGLHGQIVEVGPETVVVEVERGTRLRFDRSAIAREAGAAPKPADTAAA